MKILHVLANSSPDVNGYAVRTQMLLQYQNQMEEIENLGLTSPWYPERESMVTEHSMNSIRFFEQCILRVRRTQRYLINSYIFLRENLF